MAPASSLYFNDAAWLAGGGLRLVHPDIPNSVAERLGSRSLRFHHQVRRAVHNLRLIDPHCV